MGVVDLLGVLEDEWLVESVELISGLLNVVLDTISISIGDSVGSSFPCGLEHDQFTEILWTLNLRDHIGEAFLMLVKLEIFTVILVHGSNICFSLNERWQVRAFSGNWMIISSMMSWKFTISSVMHIFSLCTENHLSESIELILSLMNIVFDTITILISDSSINLNVNSFLGFLWDKSHLVVDLKESSLGNTSSSSLDFSGDLLTTDFSLKLDGVNGIAVVLSFLFAFSVISIEDIS